MDLDDERALVEAARTDADAFAELYRRHVERIHGFALRRTGSRSAADDVTSATFERALRRLDRFRWQPGGFAPWLFALAANEVAEHHRRKARHRTPRAQRVLGLVSRSSSPDDVGDRLDEADEHETVRRALGTLSLRHQRVLTLTYFAGLDRDQVAGALGLTVSATGVALHRAKTALARALEDTP